MTSEQYRARETEALLGRVGRPCLGDLVMFNYPRHLERLADVACFGVVVRLEDDYFYVRWRPPSSRHPDRIADYAYSSWGPTRSVWYA